MRGRTIFKRALSFVMVLAVMLSTITLPESPGVTEAFADSVTMVTGTDVVTKAMTLLGSGYNADVHYNASTNVYDCTGFVRRVMELAGFESSSIPGYTSNWIDQIKNETLALKAWNSGDSQYESVSVIYATSLADYLDKVAKNPTKFVALKTSVSSDTLSEADIPAGSVVITEKTTSNAAHAQIVIGKPVTHKTTGLSYQDVITYLDNTFAYFKSNYGLTQAQINKFKVYSGDDTLAVVKNHNSLGTWQLLPWSNTTYYKSGNFKTARSDFYVGIIDYNAASTSMKDDVWVIDDGADNSGVRLKMGVSGKTAAAPAYIFTPPRTTDMSFELSLYKCSSVNYIKVDGAVFTVYSNEACTSAVASDDKKYVMTAETGGKHTFKYTWTNVPQNATIKYLYFKETTVPNGYTADKNSSGVQAIYRAALNATDGSVTYSKRYGTSGSWTAIDMTSSGIGYIYNKPDEGSGQLVIKKTDDAGNPIAGVTFTVYSSGDKAGNLSGVVKTIVTGSDGTASISENMGNYKSMAYYVKETAAPAGYVVSDEYIRVNVINASPTATPNYVINLLYLYTKNSSGTYTETSYSNTDRLAYTVTGSGTDTTLTINYSVVNKATTSHTVVKTFGDATAKGTVSNVTAELYADGVATGKTVTLSASNNWTYTWTGLDKYKNKAAIVYTAKETQINGKAISSMTQYVAASSTSGTTTTLVNYQPTASVTLSTHKVLEGRNLKAGDVFTATITPWKDTDGDKIPDTLDTEGMVSFPELNSANGWKADKTFSYTYADMTDGAVQSNGDIIKYYKYEIKETTGSVEGVVYDTHVEEVTVKLLYSAASHTLTSGIYSGSQDTAFTNEYKASGSTDLKAFKKFDKDLEGGEFEFVLTNTLWPETASQLETRTVTNAKDGTVDFGSFDFSVSKDKNDCGTYIFTVEEKNGGTKWIDYDTTKFTVTMIVSDNGDGTLEITKSVDNAEYTPTKMTFINTSKAVGSAVIEADKIFSLPFKAGAFDFDFELVSGPDGYTFTKETKQNDDDGHVTFSTLDFDQTMCGSYRFKVTEQKGSTPGVIYDDSIYYVDITVTDNTAVTKDGKLTVTKTISKVTGEEAEAASKIEFKNQVRSLEIDKTDITTGEEIEGASLEIYKADENGEKTGEAIYSWISTKEAHVISGIEAGKYVLVETIAPEGYLRAESIVFEVKDREVLTKVNMKDDYTKLSVTKENVEGNSLLAGAQLSIYKAGTDGKKTGEALYTWTSDGSAKSITKIPAGDYVLVEEKAPEGYFLSPDVSFTVKETSSLQSVTMKDKDMTQLPTTGSSSGLIMNLMAYLFILAGAFTLVTGKRKNNTVKTA